MEDEFLLTKNEKVLIEQKKLKDFDANNESLRSTNVRYYKCASKITNFVNFLENEGLGIFIIVLFKFITCLCSLNSKRFTYI